MSNRLPQRYFFITIFLCFCSLFISAQAQTGQTNKLSQRLSIESNVLNEQRALQVILPESYYSNPNASYPVLYLLDGDYVTHGVSGVVDFLANKAQMIPDIIIVGIADKGTSKYRQYMTPALQNSDDKQGNETVDKAELFLQFLTDEVKPFIAQKFRTANNSILAGQSVGGLFVVNALLTAPHDFDHYLAISPAIWLNDHAIISKVKQLVGKKDLAQSSLYLSLGDETRQGVYALIEVLDQRPKAQINWQFKHYPDENHNSVGLLAIRNDLKTIFSAWSMSDKQLENQQSPTQLVDHYQQLIKQYGIAQTIPTPAVKSMIRYFYRQNKAEQVADFVDDAIAKLPASEESFIKMHASYLSYIGSTESALNLLEKSAKKFSSSVDYLKTLADTYLQNKQADKAKSYYQKALKLAQQQGANQWLINILEAKLAA